MFPLKQLSVKSIDWSQIDSALNTLKSLLSQNQKLKILILLHVQLHVQLSIKSKHDSVYFMQYQQYSLIPRTQKTLVCFCTSGHLKHK